MQTIGRYYETSLQYINDPISEYYIAYPSSAMECDELAGNIYNLKKQIELWEERLSYSTNATEQNNISLILQNQTDKLDAYYTEQQRCLAVQTTQAAPTEAAAEVTTATAANSSGLIIALVLGGLAIWFLSRRKRRKR